MRPKSLLLDDYGMFLLNQLLDAQEDARLMRYVEDEMERKLLQQLESRRLSFLFAEWAEYIILMCLSPDAPRCYEFDRPIMLSETVVEIAQQCVPRQVNLRQTPEHVQARKNKVQLFKLLAVVWDEVCEVRAQERMFARV